MEHFLQTYGYGGVILVTFFGAEEGVILGSLLAADGFLWLPGVILASAFGGSLGDQIYFYISYFYGERFLNRFQGIKRSLPRAQALMKRYGSPVVLASRFLAGIRIAVSVMFGLVKMPPLVYSSLSLISGLLWASFYAVLSYHFGRAVFSRLPQGEHRALWLALILIVLFVLITRLLSRKSGDGPVEP